jgi:hypothetical protein
MPDLRALDTVAREARANYGNFRASSQGAAVWSDVLNDRSVGDLSGKQTCGQQQHRQACQRDEAWSLLKPNLRTCHHDNQAQILPSPSTSRQILIA